MSSPVSMAFPTPQSLCSLRFDTLRPILSSPAAGVTTTSVPTLYLQRVPANALRFGPKHLYNVPSSALKALFGLSVHASFDVQEGDIIANITLRDNVTPWPNDRPLVTSTWHVTFVSVDSAVILPRRLIYVSRMITQGPSHF